MVSFEVAKKLKEVNFLIKNDLFSSYYTENGDITYFIIDKNREIYPAPTNEEVNNWFINNYNFHIADILIECWIMDFKEKQVILKVKDYNEAILQIINYIKFGTFEL